MGKRVLLGLGTLAAIALLVVGVWYLRLTAPVAVSDDPPPAATLAMPTAPPADNNPTPERVGTTSEATSQARLPEATEGVAASPTPTLRLYRIDPRQSEATYSVEETFFERTNRLVTAVGRTRGIAGDILLDLSNLAASQVGEIVVDISQLRSDEEGRDNAIRHEWLESLRYPHASFKNASIHNLPATWEVGQTLSFSMTGDLTVRTGTSQVTWDVRATIAPDALQGKATTGVKMTQFGFDPPNLTALRVEDDVILTLEFVAPAVDAVSAAAAAPTGAATPAPSPTTQARSCSPTASENGRPNYRPGAPVRSSAGTGHILHGTIVSSRDCAPLPGARLEVWFTNPEGEYDDDHRATVLADEQGAYRFESTMPGAYGGGTPHFHMAASAEGHSDVVRTLVLAGDEKESVLDFVLPAR